VHTHALLMLHVTLLVRHVASLTHETGPILLVLLRLVAEDVTALALGVVLIANDLVACVSVMILAARRHLNILLLLVLGIVEWLLLVL